MFVLLMERYPPFFLSLPFLAMKQNCHIHPTPYTEQQLNHTLLDIKPMKINRSWEETGCKARLGHGVGESQVPERLCGLSRRFRVHFSRTPHRNLSLKLAKFSLKRIMPVSDLFGLLFDSRECLQVLLRLGLFVLRCFIDRKCQMK